MKHITLKTTVALLAFIISSTSLFCQSVDWKPTLREVMVNYRDSVVRANIIIIAEKIKPSDNLMYYWYQRETINKNKGGFTGELLHGPYHVYNKEKKLITKGNFDNGLMTGNWKYWNDDGNLRISLEYKNGLLNGEVKVYNNQGILIESKYYKAGIEQQESDGILKTWKSGKTKKEKPDSLNVTDSADFEGPAD